MIGLPGDVVELVGVDVILNGERVARAPEAGFAVEAGMLALREQLAPDHGYVVLYEDRDPSRRPTRRWVVPPGAYFMLGDNRDRSRDSRFWDDPFVPREDMLARVVSRHWSADPESGVQRWERIGPIDE